MRLDARQRGEPTGKFRLVLGPEGADDLDVLRGARAALFVGHADRFELTAHVAHAHAEDEAPVGEHVDARQLLRQNDRVSLGKKNDPAGELDPLSHRGDEGEGGHGVDDAGRRREGGGRHLWVDDDHVLAGPDRLEVGGFGRSRDAQDGLAIGECARVDAVEADLHREHPPNPLRRAAMILGTAWETERGPHLAAASLRRVACANLRARSTMMVKAALLHEAKSALANRGCRVQHTPDPVRSS